MTNLTNTTIPESVLEVLSLGPNSSLELEKANIPAAYILATLETGIMSLDTNIQAKIRTEVVNTITNFKSKNPRTN